MDDPVFKEAIVRSIRAYLKGEAFSELGKSNYKIKYDNKYFDKIESDFFGTVKEHPLG